MESRPLLSIGMIFKNEIRCLERCMESLQPLRDAVPCELVMADTGSDDGSREIAEKYADVLFDFPWIDDFAAARNAVMDRCSGRWYFSIDCDEWLDKDISNFLGFLTGPGGKNHKSAGITIRNYTDKDLTRYGDMMGLRMVRMDTGVRYDGAVHEALNFGAEQIVFNLKVILHHDGYVVEGGPGGKAKHDRNMSLLEKQMEEKPQDLRILMECIESSRDDAERQRYIEKAVAGVKEEWMGWKTFGPPILRYDVLFAHLKDLPGLEERAKFAADRFPDSPFITIDISQVMTVACTKKKEYTKVIFWGEQYLRSIAEYRHGNADMRLAVLYGTLMSTASVDEQEVRVLLSDAYYQEKQFEKARDTVLGMKRDELDGELTRNYIGILMNLHSEGVKGLPQYAAELWEQIGVSEEPKAKESRDAVAAAAASSFQKPWREKEDAEGRAHAYTLFLPLEDKCETGLAAAVLETGDPVALTEKLLKVENWDKFSIHALAHALEHGVPFPLPGRHMSLEEMDKLADRLGKTGDTLAALAVEYAPRADTPERLCWIRGLLLSAMGFLCGKIRQEKSISKATEGIGEIEEDFQGKMGLVRTFAEIERKFLTLCYTPAVLSDEGLFMLPPMHRFGWYCVKAFEALDAGDTVGYVRFLKAGLVNCESMKPIVEFLLNHTPELQAPPSAELLALAEKVRGLLSAYPPDDPAVAALKASPAYQKVAYLIEEAGA